jgi:hypothetical protein
LQLRGSGALPKFRAQRAGWTGSAWLKMSVIPPSSLFIVNRFTGLRPQAVTFLGSAAIASC